MGTHRGRFHAVAAAHKDDQEGSAVAIEVFTAFGGCGAEHGGIPGPRVDGPRQKHGQFPPFARDRVPDMECILPGLPIRRAPALEEDAAMARVDRATVDAIGRGRAEGGGGHDHTKVDARP